MRTDMIIKAELANGFFAVAPNVMKNVLEAINDGVPRVETEVKVSNGNVVYQEINNVAVISLDGGMYKKDMSAMCMSVIAYPAIIKAIDKAEANPQIDTTLFRVDTPGGHVDGAEEVAEAIEDSKNKTITLFENTGASGGIWVFTASDEVYAVKQTMLGSIGVVATYRNQEEDSKVIEMTSSNAPNKRCKLGEDCQERMQSMLDGYEAMFFERVEKNTGFDKEKIKSTFNSGGMIFANQAKKAGFIQGTTTFKKILAKLSGGVNHSSLTASAQIIEKNSTEGISMEYTKESFEALEAAHAEALTDANTKLESATTALATVKAEKETAVAALATMQATVEAKNEATTEIMAMAFERGVDKDTLIKMAMADTLDDAKVAVIDGATSDGAFGAQKEGFSTDVKAEDEKELSARCETLDVTFVGE